MCRGTLRKATSAHSAWSTDDAFSLMKAAKSAESPKAQATATKERSPTHSSVPTAQRRAPIAKDCAANRTEHRAIPRHPENRWEPAMQATQIRERWGTKVNRRRRYTRKDAPTWRSASSVWRRSCPTSPSSPLQTEWLDIAVAKSQRTAPLVREIRKIAESESFRSAIDAIEGYEATNTGDTLRRCPHLSIGFPYSNCINSCISRFPSA